MVRLLLKKPGDPQISTAGRRSTRLGFPFQSHAETTSPTGWWLTYPSEKYEFVSWDDYSQYMEKQKMFHTTNQLCAPFWRCSGHFRYRSTGYHIKPRPPVISWFINPYEGQLCRIFPIKQGMFTKEVMSVNLGIINQL